jgi:hypothetical protein
VKYRYDIKQGSEEWLQARLGIPTASEFDKIITPAKLELSKSSKPYMHKLLAEWMYGAPLEAFVSPWMERGKELEPEAVRYYEMERGVDTQEVGIVLTDDGMIGASPDRLVGEDGLLELKCPALETHVGYMLDPQSLVADYRLQTQGQLWLCHDRPWSDLMSYHPGFPAVIVRQKADDKVFNAISDNLTVFLDTLLKCREKLTHTYGELRRERVTARQRVEESRAAFDEFIQGPQMRGVV